MRAFLLISCAALGVAACGGGNDADEANMADANMTGTDNLAAVDMATNTPDTNVANGL